MTATILSVEALDFLNEGVYTYKDVARLLRTKPQTIRRWVEGYTLKRRVEDGFRESPLRTNRPLDKTVTFRELIELRIVAKARELNVSLKEIVDTALELEKKLGSFPLAQANLRTDGKQIIQQVSADHWQQPSSGQKICEFIDSFSNSLSYDESGSANSWTVEGTNNIVVLTPTHLMGEPRISGRRISTWMLYCGNKAGDSAELLADNYDLTIEEVQAAIEFEKRLSA
jgi:uncharacterized protein (DUF433 family)